MAQSFAGTRHFSPEQHESATFTPAKVKARSPERVMDMSGWSHAQRHREGANLGLRIVFQLFVQTLPTMVPFVLPVRFCVGFKPTSRFLLQCGPSVPRDVLFLRVPCVAGLHIPANGEVLTFVAQEQTVYKRGRVEGPFGPTTTTFTSCRCGSMEPVAGSQQHPLVFLRISSLA